MRHFLLKNHLLCKSKPFLSGVQKGPFKLQKGLPGFATQTVCTMDTPTCVLCDFINFSSCSSQLLFFHAQRPPFSILFFLPPFFSLISLFLPLHHLHHTHTHTLSHGLRSRWLLRICFFFFFFGCTLSEIIFNIKKKIQLMLATSYF